MSLHPAPLNTIERLLEEKIGLSVDTIGFDTIASVVERRMTDCDLSDDTAYVRHLMQHEDEWDELIEAVVVPETWFFRNEESFVFLGRYLRTDWTKRNPGGIIRALSIPCSSGEEPYSIAMTFLEAGLSPDQFEIDAIDISHKALTKARRGVYGPESFRRHDTLPLRERYFTGREDGRFHVHQSLLQTVRWRQGNLLDDRVLPATLSYDIVFCRNLLIYLSAAARRHVSATIDRVLARRGLLFVGHAERPLFQARNFVAVTIPGVFAYYREGQVDECQICREQRVKPQFERRKTRRISDNARPLAPPARPAVSEAQAAQPAAMRQRAPLPPVLDRRKPRDKATQTLDQARELADQGSLKEALRLCDAVLHENAAHVQAHFLMGLVYQALKDDQRAETSFNKALYLDPDHHEALYYLALMMEERGQPAKAKQLRQRIHRIYQRKERLNADD